MDIKLEKSTSKDLSEPPGDKEDINSNTTSKRSTSHPPNQPIRTVAQSNTNGKPLRRPARKKIGLTTQAVGAEEEKDAAVDNLIGVLKRKANLIAVVRDQVELVRVIERLEKGLRHLIEENGSSRERISEWESIGIKFEGLVEIERQEKQKLKKLLKDSNKLLRLESDKRSNRPKKQESALDELWTSAKIKVRNNGILIRTGNSVKPIIMTAQADTRRTDAEMQDGYDHYLENKRTGQMEELAIVVVVAYYQWIWKCSGSTHKGMDREGFQGLEQDKDNTRTKERKDRGYRIK
ncbi:hypothetical protein PPACK8108_LOCUS20922 [Phakopsora pachyrhizi]|uniref:Uncharacterized protein n=1 Tax=Phakopsora pachyrhizi TaxID=170000 RepID=A0AAV0BGI1_PHAPC|nr:hypothetical protein PPACK8108_LOCUS20922 [Phakopsora pachyrhizi]